MCYISFKQLLGMEILYWNHFTSLLIPAAAFTVIASDNNDSRPNFQTVSISRYLWRFDTSVSKEELKTTSLPWFLIYLFSIFAQKRYQPTHCNMKSHECTLSLDLFVKCIYPSSKSWNLLYLIKNGKPKKKDLSNYSGACSSFDLI